MEYEENEHFANGYTANSPSRASQVAEFGRSLVEEEDAGKEHTSASKFQPSSRTTRASALISKGAGLFRSAKSVVGSVRISRFSTHPPEDKTHLTSPTKARGSLNPMAALEEEEENHHSPTHESIEWDHRRLREREEVSEPTTITGSTAASSSTSSPIRSSVAIGRQSVTAGVRAMKEKVSGAITRKSKLTRAAAERQLKSADNISKPVIVEAPSFADNPRSFLDLYEMKEKLGMGTYGVVSRAVLKASGNGFAVKVINKSQLRDLRHLKREVTLMRKLDHPHVLRLFETLEDRRTVYLILEECEGGELFDRIIQAGTFTEQKAAIIMRQIFETILYLHDHHICHRDIKPENFLFTSSEEDISKNFLKVIDFGLATEFIPGQVLTTKVGSPHYVAPQVLTGKYDASCDVWSSGVVLYVLLCGYPPFYGQSDVEVLRKVQDGKCSFDSHAWEDISEDAKSLIRILLSLNPQDRCSTREALQHTWVKDNAATTSNAPLDSGLIDNLRNFRSQCRLKKLALYVIASVLDDERISSLRDLFMQLDIDGDGVLSGSEFAEGLRKVDGLATTRELEQLMKDVDADGSGTVDYTEFVAAALSRRTYLQEDVCWSAFCRFDKNGDGRISVNELEEVLKCGRVEGVMGAQATQQLLKEVDVNGDGLIDFEEFMAMMRGTNQGENAFAKKDGNDSGKDDDSEEDGAGEDEEEESESNTCTGTAATEESEDEQTPAAAGTDDREGDCTAGETKPCAVRAEDEIAATKIQSAHRGRLARRNAKKLRQKKEMSAEDQQGTDEIHTQRQAAAAAQGGQEELQAAAANAGTERPAAEAEAPAVAAEAPAVSAEGPAVEAEAPAAKAAEAQAAQEELLVAVACVGTDRPAAETEVSAVKVEAPAAEAEAPAAEAEAPSAEVEDPAAKTEAPAAEVEAAAAQTEAPAAEVASAADHGVAAVAKGVLHGAEHAVEGVEHTIEGLLHKTKGMLHGSMPSGLSSELVDAPAEKESTCSSPAQSHPNLASADELEPLAAPPEQALDAVPEPVSVQASTAIPEELQLAKTQAAMRIEAARKAVDTAQKELEEAMSQDLELTSKLQVVMSDEKGQDQRCAADVISDSGPCTTSPRQDGISTSATQDAASDGEPVVWMVMDDHPEDDPETESTVQAEAGRSESDPITPPVSGTSSRAGSFLMPVERMASEHLNIGSMGRTESPSPPVSEHVRASIEELARKSMNRRRSCAAPRSQVDMAELPAQMRRASCPEQRRAAEVDALQHLLPENDESF